jgi:hypothetical protein
VVVSAFVGTIIMTGCVPTPVPAAPTSTTETPAVATVTPAVAIAPTPAAIATVPSPVAWTPPARSKTSGCVSQGGLPDAACTPGAVDPRVNQDDVGSTVCTSGYTRTVRPSTTITDRIKRDQMAAYGLQGQRLADYELDHLIPLELGGAPADVANLWPELWNGDGSARQKDAVENHLHDQICRGTMMLADAQRAIATDWMAVYRARGLQATPLAAE